MLKIRYNINIYYIYSYKYIFRKLFFSQYILFFSNRMIDGTEVIYETYEKRRLNYEDRPRKEEASSGHHDCITDIATTKSPQNFLITSSMNGVIKVWK